MEVCDRPVMLGFVEQYRRNIEGQYRRGRFDMGDVISNADYHARKITAYLAPAALMIRHIHLAAMCRHPGATVGFACSKDLWEKTNKLRHECHDKCENQNGHFESLPHD